MLNNEACFAKFIIDKGITQLVSDTTHINNLLDLLHIDDSLAVFNVQVLQPLSTYDLSSVTWQTWFPRDTCFESAYNIDFGRADYIGLNRYLNTVDFLH